MAALAEAAALKGIAGHRHRARLEAAAIEKQPADLLEGIARKDDATSIRTASEADKRSENPFRGFLLSGTQQ
jgi:hypothetical protein